MAARDVLESLVQFFTDPMHMLLAATVLYVVFAQYRQVTRLEYTLYGWPKHSVREELTLALVNGVAVGLLTSLAWALTGRWLVLPDDPAQQEMALIVLALMSSVIGFAIRGRGAYAYAVAGMLALNLMLGWPQVAPTTLVTLLGVLTVMEGLLILLTGSSCATPLFLPGREDQPQGGFSLRRTWPVPFVLPLMVGGHLVMFPVAMAMSYVDLAVTQPPAERARAMGVRTLAFGLMALVLAVGMDRLPVLAWVAVPLIPLAHFLLARPNMEGQIKGRPYLERPYRGVGVLDVLPGSVAEAAGMRTGDVIVEVDNQAVYNRRDLHAALLEGQAYVTMQFKSGHDLHHCRLPRTHEGLGGLGAILLPEAGDSHVQFGSPSPLQRVIARLRRSRSSE